MRSVDALELIVDEGRPANAWRFFQLGHDLLTLLDELSEVPIAWRIEDLHTGSALVTVAPPADQPEEGRVLRLAYSSLGAVQRGGALSDEWSPDAVRVAHRFVEHGQRAENEDRWVPPRLRLVGDVGASATTLELTPDLGERLLAWGVAGTRGPPRRRRPGPAAAVFAYESVMIKRRLEKAAMSSGRRRREPVERPPVLSYRSSVDDRPLRADRSSFDSRPRANSGQPTERTGTMPSRRARM